MDTNFCVHWRECFITHKIAQGPDLQKQNHVHPAKVFVNLQVLKQDGKKFLYVKRLQRQRKTQDVIS